MAVETKEKLSKYSYEELLNLIEATNFYDWTILYIQRKKGEIDQKQYSF
jgi:hypothetical protein